MTDNQSNKEEVRPPTLDTWSKVRAVHNALKECADQAQRDLEEARRAAPNEPYYRFNHLHHLATTLDDLFTIQEQKLRMHARANRWKL